MSIRKIAAGLLLATILQPAMAETFNEPRLLGEVRLPTGLSLAGQEFGGISGLDYDPASGVFYAISDDRSEKAPARFYQIKLPMDEEGLHGVDIVSSHVLKGGDGQPFPKGGTDPEAIRFKDGHLYWSSERDANKQARVYEASVDGGHVRTFELPEHYLVNAEGKRGAYDNLAFESLAVSADGSALFVGTENALQQDGGKATLEAGSPTRIMRADLSSGKAAAEYVYETDPIFTRATAEPYYNDNGVSEILALKDGRLLVVERSFALGVGNEIKFYIASFDGATDVSSMPSINGHKVSPMGKTLLFKIGEGDFGLDIDNIEAATFGPEIGGKPTLVLASDNNFNPQQFTQFVVFQVDDY